jgi:hypothetical protein
MFFSPFHAALIFKIPLPPVVLPFAYAMCATDKALLVQFEQAYSYSLPATNPRMCLFMYLLILHRFSPDVPESHMNMLRERFPSEVVYSTDALRLLCTKPLPRHLSSQLDQDSTNVNVVDEEGNTPMHWWFATQVGWRSIFTSFLWRGADMHAKNIYGQTALDVMICTAKRMQHKDTLPRKQNRTTPMLDLISSLLANNNKKREEASASAPTVDARVLFEAVAIVLAISPSGEPVTSTLKLLEAIRGQQGNVPLEVRHEWLQKKR